MTTVPPNPPSAPPTGWQQPPSPPAAAVIKKKKRRWPWIVLAVVVIIGIISAVNSGKNKSTTATGNAATSTTAEAAATPGAESPTTAEVATPEQPSAAAEPGIGSPVRDGKFEFVVQSVEPGKTQIGSDMLNTKAQGEFVIVTVQVTNTANEAQSFFGSNVKAYDAQQRKYSASDTAAIYLEESKSLYEQINPGNTVIGKVVFDVPTGTQLNAIELHDSAFSGGVTVRL